MPSINDIKEYTSKITESPGANNLKKLEDKNVISSQEENQISKIVETITSAKEFNEKAEEVIKFYKKIMDDEHSGKMARVISCIAADSAKNKYQKPNSPTERESNKIEYVLGINIVGALFGALVGSEAGGREGAIFGALIGATSSSATT